MFERAADRAGITKPYTPTNFRKSNAAWLARENAPQSLIEDRQGRKRGSEHIARYVARFGPESERIYAELNGLTVNEDDSDPTGPIDCPRCDHETPRHEPTCVWCGQSLSSRSFAVGVSPDRHGTPRIDGSAYSLVDPNAPGV